MDQLLVAIQVVADLEAKLQLTEPWTDNHPEYRVTLDYLQQRDYHRALDKLQRLVVQRLFELSKANLSGMGNNIFCCIRKPSANIYFISCRLLASHYYLEGAQDS